MASKATKKPVTKKVATKSVTKAVKKPVKTAAVKKPVKAVAKPITKVVKQPTKVVNVKKETIKPVVKEEVKKVEVKVEEKVTNTGKGEVIATRGRSKDSSILEGVLIGLGIILLGLCAGGFFLIKNSADGNRSLQIVVPIFGAIGLLFIATSIVFIVEGHRNNKNKKDCIVYYGASKTFELNGYRGKTVSVKADQVMKVSSACKMLVVTYKKANGKNKRINLGWSKDRKLAKQRVADLHK